MCSVTVRMLERDIVVTLFVYLSVCLSVCLSTCVSVCLSVADLERQTFSISKRHEHHFSKDYLEYKQDIVGNSLALLHFLHWRYLWHHN